MTKWKMKEQNTRTGEDGTEQEREAGLQTPRPAGTTSRPMGSMSSQHGGRPRSPPQHQGQGTEAAGAKAQVSPVTEGITLETA